MRLGSVVALLAAAWLVSPAAASAHVGRSPVVAVSDDARITQVTPAAAPFEVHVIDGDQALWLRLSRGHELMVLGAIGEPLLRFDHAGVFVNSRSPTAQIDRIGGIAISASFDARTRPLWKKLTNGRSYLWHDHRLHALAPLGGAGRARKLGDWWIPLRLDGRAAEITGGLWYLPAPDLWLWLTIPLLITAGALAISRTGHEILIARANAILAVATAIGFVATRAGREFYGRPTPALGGYISFAIGVTLAGWALYLLWRHTDARWLIGLSGGILTAATMLTLLPILYHSVALTAIPAPLERAGIAFTLGTAVATTLLSFFIGLHDSTAEAREPGTV